MAKKKNPSPPANPVTMVENPYNLSALEVAEAQNSSEELVLENELDLNPEAVDSPDFNPAHSGSYAASLQEMANDWNPDGEANAAEIEVAAEAVVADAAPTDALNVADTEETITTTSAPTQVENAPSNDDSAEASTARALRFKEIDADLEPGIEEGAPDSIDINRLVNAIAEADRKTQEEMSVNSTSDVDLQAQTLAEQIAEDQALAREMELDAGDDALRAGEAQEGEEKAEETLAPNLDQEEIESCIETLLFMTDKPIALKKLHELLGPDYPFNIFQEAITALKDRYQAVSHGIELVEVGGGLQFRTKPGRAHLAKKLAKVQSHKLSSGAMETLAIVAYKQPIMKEEIDKIRGVDSSYFIRGLMDKKLISINGRSELPGRPMLYGTTDEFLQLFGLKDLNAMPSLRELEQMVPSSQAKGEHEDDPRIIEMRRLVGEMKADESTRLVYDPREDEKILKEIRQKVNSIQTSSPYLDEQKAQEKAAAEAAKAENLGVLPGDPGTQPAPNEGKPGEQANLLPS